VYRLALGNIQLRKCAFT